MARMHSRKKGQSGSARPKRETPPEWMDYSSEEVEELVIKLSKEGRKASEIGTVLRDQHGVPSVKLSTGKTIKKIMDEKGFKKELPEDLSNLIVRAVSLDKHMKANPQDVSSKRGLQLIESKIRRLVKYYKKENVLSQDWKYSLSSAKLLVK